MDLWPTQFCNITYWSFEKYWFTELWRSSKCEYISLGNILKITSVSIPLILKVFMSEEVVKLTSENLNFPKFFFLHARLATNGVSCFPWNDSLISFISGKNVCHISHLHNRSFCHSSGKHGLARHKLLVQTTTPVAGPFRKAATVPLHVSHMPPALGLGKSIVSTPVRRTLSCGSRKWRTGDYWNSVVS